MRRARIAGDPGAAANCHHLMSRVIEGRFIFDRVVKEKFREFLEAHCAFAGVELITWCCMSNHFHLLVQVQVPNAEESRATFLASSPNRRSTFSEWPKRSWITFTATSRSSASSWPR